MTLYYGHAERKQLTKPQELDYLREFKKRFSMPYGIAVSEAEDNERNYGISSIPTTFLIDRQGHVRFISVGSSDVETAALLKMIKKLLDEPPPQAAAR